jgi:hypothetical protein
MNQGNFTEPVTVGKDCVFVMGDNRNNSQDSRHSSIGLVEKREILGRVIFLLIPGTLFLGTRLTGRWYYLTSTLLIIETMIPFFLAFESRKPQARELVTIAVMCALAVASRVVIPFPNFKPIIAIVMITGIAFGAQTGFLTGAEDVDMVAARTLELLDSPDLARQMGSAGKKMVLEKFAWRRMSDILEAEYLRLYQKKS